MKVYKGKTFAEVYKESLNDLLYNPEYEAAPRGLKIKENLNVALVIEEPLSCLYRNERRSSQFKYISAELLWYFMGRNDVEFIKDYAKFWLNIQNEDGTVNSSYGNLLFSKKTRYGHTQYEWVIKSLIADKDSRQAIMHFNLPEHQYFGNKDFVCTMHTVFSIRENKLNMTVSMRSNDAILGTPTDAAFFAILQSQLLNHLKEFYPDLELGTYTHIASSYHIYESHFSLVEDMLKSEFISESIPKVNENLIFTNGTPTSNFYALFNNRTSESCHFSDSLFCWILKNINAK